MCFLSESLILVIGIATLLMFLKMLKDTFFRTSKTSASLKIVEVTNERECQDACFLLKCDLKDLRALGFDCEWVSGRPVALIQLASVHGLCCLFRLNLLGTIPVELNKILRDPDILKLGVSALNDAKLLKRYFDCQVCGTLDLGHLYSSNRSLAFLAASEIGITLDKSFEIVCSNWEAPQLTDSQKEYAAKDAFVAMELFKKWLLRKGPGPYYNLCKLAAIEISSYVDLDYSPNHGIRVPDAKYTPEGYYRNPKKDKGFVTRKTPLYDNCFMYAPDEELLCSCDRRKAQWYLDRDLADVLLEEPYSIRLRFEPTARAGKSNGGRFYQQLKQNHCVVCGAHHSYLKHHVIPKEYRKHLPKEMKDHQSHDILLMCINCHHVASQHNKALREHLAHLCDAPINNPKITQNRTVQKVKNSAKALLVSGKPPTAVKTKDMANSSSCKTYMKSNIIENLDFLGDVIPKERKTALENEVKAYYEVETITTELLKEAANLESAVKDENVECHGIKVVNYFSQNSGLTELEILWREHFLATMKPKYLPALWSVTHNHSRLKEKQIF